MTLRTEVVKAVAQAIQYADDHTPTEVGWETFDAHAAAALDAVLDTLEQARAVSPAWRIITDDLLKELREATP